MNVYFQRLQIISFELLIFSISATMTDREQQPITFQSKFAARKAQEDKSFMGLYSGSFHNRISGDIRHVAPATESNQTSLTQEGTWERQRLTSTQNVAQKNNWGMSSSYVDPPSHQMAASQQNPGHQQASAYHQPLGSASFTGKRLVGSSSNSGLSHNQPGAFVDLQHGRGDYRGTMEKPASQSLNYDNDHEGSRYGVMQPGSNAQISTHSGAGLRGRSQDAVEHARSGYRAGPDGMMQSASQTGLAGQKINGHATYDLYNYGRENHAFQDVFKHRAGRNDSSFDRAPTNEHHPGLSASVGKPSLGGYGYSAGPAASRKLDYAPDARTAPFEMHAGYGRNSNQAQTNEFNRVSENYGDHRDHEIDKKDNKIYEEVVDGYTEYFSQGCDYNGQLGHGQDPSQHDRNRHVNVPKSLSFDILIRTVSCGGSHTLILSKQGELFSIGSNEYGQLGLNDRQLTFTTAPLLVQEVQGKGLQVKQVASGQNHSLLLTQGGHVYAWGSNIYGQCGLSKPASGQNSPSFVQGECDMNRIYGPQRVRTEHLCNDNIKDVSAGENFSGFLTAEGDVYTFGDNSEGQLGVGSSTNTFNEPRKVKCDEKIAQVSLGYQHMLLLTFSGRVLGAGRNREHQLGMGAGHHGHPEQCFSMPVRIDAIRDVEVLKVIAGGFSAALIQNAYQRQLLVWGQGDFGIFEKPQKLYMDDVDFADIQISKFSTNNPFALAIEKSGKVYSWGSNTLGQLGHGDQRVRKLPTQIQSLKRKTINQLSIGHNFVVMLGRDVSQAEQQKKKQKRKMQKEAKERERQQRNNPKTAKQEAQDENRRPMTNINGMDGLLSKERDYERRDSNQPATPKLPGESARESLGLRSGGNGQESVGRSRPKSANNVVRGIIDEMEKISTKGQGLLDRVKNLKEAHQQQLSDARSGRSPYSRERDPMRPGAERSTHQEDPLMLKASQTYGPTKSASFGETATDHEDNREQRWGQADYQKHQSHYGHQQPSYMENPNSNSDRRLTGAQPQGYQPMTMESNKRYMEEIEDLRRQLRTAKDHGRFEIEINELKHQLQRANQENKQLREDQRHSASERDQEMVKTKNQLAEQSRQYEDLKEECYQKDRELGDLRTQLGEQSTQNHEAKRTMIDQESKIKQVEKQYDQLQSTYESKIKELDQEKMDLGKELDDAAAKNQQLMSIVKQKQVELHETQKIADQAKTMKKQLGKLEEIIDDLQAKNKELNELLNRKMVERAESYKKQVVDFLNKPKAYEVDTTKEVRKTDRTEVNTQYKRLQEELDREQMTHIQDDRQLPNRRSFNEKNFQDYRKDQTFASEYGKRLNTMNNSIHQQDKENDGHNRQMHNSEKKRSHYVEYNPADNGREQRDHSHELGNNGGEYKTRSVPRYSKINKMSSSPFFHGDRRDTQEGIERERYEHGKKYELKSDYQRNNYALGQSIEGPINQSSYPEAHDRNEDLQRSRNDGTYTEPNEATYSYKEQQYYDHSRPQQNGRTDDLDANQDDCRYPRVVNSAFPRDRAEADGSRSRFDPDASLGRPPLTGQRYSEKEREQSAERKHSRVRSGHNPAHSTSRVDGSKHVTVSHNLNDSHSRNANEEPTGVQSSHRMSHQRSNSERRYSGERANYPRNLHASNRDGSAVHSREGLSVRSRDQSRGPVAPIDRAVERHNTTKSKARKEYVDITDGSENSDRNRKVHRIDLAQDDQEDIQKQIQQKLTRIQKIFQGQQQRQVDDNTAYSVKDPVTSGARLHDDDGASFNERISMHTKDRTPVESQSFTGRPIDGAKTPATVSLTELNGKDGGNHNNYLRMNSNPTSSILKSEDQKKAGGHEYDTNGHQRRKSLSHNPPSYAHDYEAGSRVDEKGSYRQGDTSEFGQQQNYRPGEMRYTQDDLHDIRD